uniref:Kinesin-related protein 11-like n=1 Tax=Rhizophora mucronata TaxID=61149 RepID=A0A2P2M325_RHIMU
MFSALSKILQEESSCCVFRILKYIMR